MTHTSYGIQKGDIILYNNQHMDRVVEVDEKFIRISNESVLEKNKCVRKVLYIATDDEIKTNDYFICDFGLLKCGSSRKENVEIEEKTSYKCHKVIASSDKLEINSKIAGISDEFINEFIKQSNKKVIIKDVMVKYLIKDTGTEQEHDRIETRTEAGTNRQFDIGVIDRPILKNDNIVIRVLPLNYYELKSDLESFKKFCASKADYSNSEDKILKEVDVESWIIDNICQEL